LVCCTKKNLAALDMIQFVKNVFRLTNPLGGFVIFLWKQRLCAHPLPKKHGDLFVFLLIFRWISALSEGRVAKFFLVQNTKTGENIPNYLELY
jgi:hypothetical protein